MRRLVVAVALVALGGCKEDMPPPTTNVIPDGFDLKALYTNLGENVVAGTLAEFVDATAALRVATSSLAAARMGGGGDLGAAQAAWRSAMTIWQRAEVMQFGPAGAGTDVRGGQDLRAEIYSWPTANACRVDQELVAKSYAAADFFTRSLVDRYGLDAIEYLLFHDGADNNCPDRVEINEQGTWGMIAADELQRRRAIYADAAAGHLVQSAQKLHRAWAKDGGNFIDAMVTAGSGSTVYTDPHHVLDDMFVAIFYIDLKTKDAKIAIPSAISADCTTNTCPDRLESRWAKHSKENVRANLEGLLAVIAGGDGPGLDTLLKAVGAPELAASMESETRAAIAAVDALQPSFVDALASDRDTVRAIHTAVRKVTDLLKSQFVTVLNLKIPDEGAGDND